MKHSEYHIIHANDTQLLTEEVEDALLQGYICLGGVMVYQVEDENWFCQALVKQEEDDTEQPF